MNICFKSKINFTKLSILLWCIRYCTSLIPSTFLTFGPSKRRYAMTFEEANSTCRSLGARLASEKKVMDIEAAGSFCCICGWTSSDIGLFPRVPGKAGCDWNIRAFLRFSRYANAWCMADKGTHDLR